MDDEEGRGHRVMKTRTTRILVGEFRWWVVFVPIAVVLAALLFVGASQLNREIVNLVPADPFALAVFSLSVALGVTLGYLRGGLFLVLFVVSSVWFGSVYYGTQQSASDTAPPGAELAVLVAMVGAIGYGIPSYAVGRGLRALVARFQGN